MSMHVPNAHRVRTGRLGTKDSDGNNGAFFVPNRVCRTVVNTPLAVIASDGSDAPDDHPCKGWEHVSVSLPNRCPTWEEMHYVKCMFWDDDDCVMQLHPPASAYVNNHPYCLHLWRPLHATIPLPPQIAVGFRDLTPRQAEALADIGHE